MEAAAACSHSCSLAPQDFPAGCQAARQAWSLLSKVLQLGLSSVSYSQAVRALGAPASSTQTKQMTLHAPGAAHFQPLSQWNRTFFPRITVPIQHLSKLQAEPGTIVTDILSSKGSVNNLVCLLTTSCITATPGTCSHPKTPWLKQFEFVTYKKNSTPH